jgi:hypothetical protein
MNTITSDAVLQEQEERQQESPESLRLQRVYIRSQAVVSRRIAGETLIVPVRGKVGDLASIYSFNASGTFLWDTLASPQSLAGLIEAVRCEYAVAQEQAEHDVKQFLTDTLSAGLVEAREEVFMPAMNSSAQYELHASGAD